MIKIADLSYLENTSENELILGGVLVGLDTNVLTMGDTTQAATDVTAKARELKKGGVAMVRGTSVAIGEETDVLMNVYGIGDKVVEKTKTKYFPNQDKTVVRGFAIAIDHP